MASDGRASRRILFRFSCATQPGVTPDYSDAGRADLSGLYSHLRCESTRAVLFGEIVQESLELATVVKMNDAEVPQVLALLGLQPVEEPGAPKLRIGAEQLLAEFPTLQMIAITCGPNGSLLVTRDEWRQHPGIPVKVADTIGAGDAFTAAMTHYLLRGADLLTLNEAGNRWGHGWLRNREPCRRFQ